MMKSWMLSTLYLSIYPLKSICLFVYLSFYVYGDIGHKKYLEFVPFDSLSGLKRKYCFARFEMEMGLKCV